MKRSTAKQPAEQPCKRCAIYTRKSVEDGLEMDYNSLDAQRDTGENYIASQRGNGWICLPERYDDGGFSGGNTNRPALKRLLDDCRDGKVDVVVVYKIDRLSRSISDFADLSKKFDEYGVSFCAVTQDINTATSAGRMMVNILITFAQYEREVISERIRDKFAASRKKGMWMGGCVPLGYRVEDRKLVVVPEDAELVRRIFRRYHATQSPVEIARELASEGIVKKSGKSWDTASIIKLLHNCTYVGKVSHNGEEYSGEHEAIIDDALWNEVQAFMADSASRCNAGGNPRNSGYSAPLKNILTCGHCGGTMTAYSKLKGGVAYTYYRCSRDIRRPLHTCPIRQIPAQTVEDAVYMKVADIFRNPELIANLSEATGVSQQRLSKALTREFWETATNREKQRICELLLERVTLYKDRMELEIRSENFSNTLEEIKHD